MRLKGNAGHTLIETMISLAILLVVIAGIYTTLYVGNTSWAIQDTSVNVQGQARRAIARMTQDLRVGQGIAIVQDADNVDVSFTRSGDIVTYAWTTDAGSTQNQLIRTVDGVSVVVAPNISALSFIEATNDIKIALKK